jgi:hypothetical protein
VRSSPKLPRSTQADGFRVHAALPILLPHFKPDQSIVARLSGSTRNGTGAARSGKCLPTAELARSRGWFQTASWAQVFVRSF